MFTRRNYEYLMDTVIKDKSLDDPMKFLMVKTLGRYFKRDIHNFNPTNWCLAWNKRKNPALSLSDLNYPEESNS